MLTVEKSGEFKVGEYDGQSAKKQEFRHGR
jgi:hypothetical protein